MQASSYTAPVLYGLLILAGTVLFGLVLAPALGIATGLFVIDTESRAFFSLLTLKAAPVLAVLSLFSGASYPWTAKRNLATRAVLLLANVLAAWSFGAALALFTLR